MVVAVVLVHVVAATAAVNAPARSTSNAPVTAFTLVSRHEYFSCRAAVRTRAGIPPAGYGRCQHRRGGRAAGHESRGLLGANDGVSPNHLEVVAFRRGPHGSCIPLDHDVTDCKDELEGPDSPAGVTLALPRPRRVQSEDSAAAAAAGAAATAGTAAVSRLRVLSGQGAASASLHTLLTQIRTRPNSARARCRYTPT